MSGARGPSEVKLHPYVARDEPLTLPEPMGVLAGQSSIRAQPASATTSARG